MEFCTGSRADRHRQRPQRFQHIIDVSNESRAVTDEIVTTGARRTVDSSRNSKDLTPLFHRVPCCVQSAAVAGRFDHDHPQ